MSTRTDQLPIRVRNEFRAGQLDQAVVVLNQSICIEQGKALGVEKKILFHFVADRFGQHQFAHLSSAERERGFVEPPRGDDSASQNIRVEE